MDYDAYNIKGIFCQCLYSLPVALSLSHSQTVSCAIASLGRVTWRMAAGHGPGRLMSGNVGQKITIRMCYLTITWQLLGYIQSADYSRLLAQAGTTANQRKAVAAS